MNPICKDSHYPCKLPKLQFRSGCLQTLQTPAALVCNTVILTGQTSVCLVPRVLCHGLEGSTLGRHFTLDHTPTVQRKPWQVFWSTRSFPPGDTSRSGPRKEQWQSEGKRSFTPVVRCLLCNNEGQTSHPCWSKEL